MPDAVAPVPTRLVIDGDVQVVCRCGNRLGTRDFVKAHFDQPLRPGHAHWMRCNTCKVFMGQAPDGHYYFPSRRKQRQLARQFPDVSATAKA